MARAAFWLRGPPVADSRFGLITIIFFLEPLPLQRFWAGGDQPCPFSSVGSGVQTPSLVHDRSPRNLSLFPVRRRGWHRRAHPPPSHARRPWPVCRPGI